MDTIKVTDFAEFWRAVAGQETRYYASRDPAMQFDPEATKVKGYAVYDTTVSVVHAVEVYPTKEQALEHRPTPAMKSPTSAVDDEHDGGAAYTAYQANPHIKTEAEKPSKRPRAKSKSKRGG